MAYYCIIPNKKMKKIVTKEQNPGFFIFKNLGGCSYNNHRVAEAEKPELILNRVRIAFFQ
jgi:G:T-mismatch repair DNA endonuclease (very short patch repair protein)